MLLENEKYIKIDNISINQIKIGFLYCIYLFCAEKTMLYIKINKNKVKIYYRYND